MSTCVRCLYRVIEVSENFEGRFTFRLGAAQPKPGAPAETTLYHKYTPAGSATLCAATRLLEPGAYVWFTFTPADGPDARWGVSSITSQVKQESVELGCSWDTAQPVHNGSFSMTIANEALLGRFKAGERYSMEYGPVEQDEATGSHAR